jgi:hypothetical protein
VLSTYFKSKKKKKNQIIIPKKKKPTGQPGVAFEDTAFKTGFEIVKF